MLLLRFSGDGTVFFEQERVGHKGRLFQMLKFITMLKDSHKVAGGLITLRKDKRLTPMGGFLRASKINEFPQFLNILKGDMSFVGPRPVPIECFRDYPEAVQKNIYNVKPGLTGIGSLVFRNEDVLVSRMNLEGINPQDYYRDVIYPYKGELESWYRDHYSFKTDLIIFLLTFYSIFVPENKLVFRIFKDLPTPEL